MVECWYEALRSLSKEVRARSQCPYPTDVVLFYLARWSQKTAGESEPNLAELAPSELQDAAARIARHLSEDGERVDQLVQGDAEVWTGLRYDLLASAARRAGPAAGEQADEALQKIALVLLTGTPPSQAGAQLETDLAGPRNEYVFQSPFRYWARAVVIHLVVDDQRRTARERGLAEPAGKGAPPLDRALLRRAVATLPDLLHAIRGLPPKQRSVMVLSLGSRDLDELAREHLHELAPDLFSEVDAANSADREIAERLKTTTRLVAANRSAARRKLALRDPLWGLLLDVLLPHSSTRPVPIADPEGQDA